MHALILPRLFLQDRLVLLRVVSEDLVLWGDVGDVVEEGEGLESGGGGRGVRHGLYWAVGGGRSERERDGG